MHTRVRQEPSASEWITPGQAAPLLDASYDDQDQLSRQIGQFAHPRPAFASEQRLSAEAWTLYSALLPDNQ